METTYRLQDLHVREPFVTNKGVVLGARHVFVELAWEGHVGYGAAQVTTNYGLDEREVAGLMETCRTVLSGRSPEEREALLDELGERLRGKPMALCAIDMALHDLWGKCTGMPLHKLLGLSGTPLRHTCLSLGVHPDETLLALAERYTDWPILKLKMAVGSDTKVVERLRAVYKGRLWVDGNGCWPVEEAIRISASLARHDVELFEQPIRPGSLEDLERLSRESAVPILADEDSLNVADVRRLEGRVQAISIKLLRCGGIREALRMITAAREAGLGVLIGCITESALGITAAAQLSGAADLLDLDGHLDLVDDPFTGLQVSTGRVLLPTGPGLGVTQD